jgi:hypothetical protein
MDHTPAPNSDSASDTQTNPLLKFWEALAFYMDHAFSLFGHPAQLAQRLWLTRREHKLFCDYVRPLEAMARRLIFMLALDLAPMTLPPAPERKYRARLGMAANVGASFDMAAPETWRATFHLGAAAYGPPASSPALVEADVKMPAGRRRSITERISSAASAHRLEALLRAINQRERYAAALARKFARTPAAALAYTMRPSRKRAHKTGYVTLFELIPLAADAYQTWLHRKLDALLPNTS